MQRDHLIKSAENLNAILFFEFFISTGSIPHSDIFSKIWMFSFLNDYMTMNLGYFLLQQMILWVSGIRLSRFFYFHILFRSVDENINA